MPPINEAVDLSPEKVQFLLKPHLEKLSHCFEEAWEEWKLIATKHPGLSARSRATVVNDLVWIAVNRTFVSTRGAVLVDKGMLRTLSLEDRVTIRFKKLDRHMRPRNIMTRQQHMFQNQEHLPGLPPLDKLTMGYVLTALHDSIETIAITFQKGNSLAWAFQVPLTQTAIVLSPFTQPVAEVTRVRRVRLKQQDQEGNEQTGSA